jgi:hypothetical protein
VAILCNLGTIAPQALARHVADEVLADAFTQPLKFTKITKVRRPQEIFVIFVSS